MDELGDEEAELITSWSMEKGRPTRIKNWFDHWKYHPIIKMTRTKDPAHSKISIIGGDRDMGTNDRETGRIWWWSREVDLKLVMGLKRFYVLGLVEMFLQKDEVSLARNMWYGRNSEGGRQASDGVGVLVNRSLESRVSSAREGLVWVELRGEGRRILMIGVVYVNSEGVRVEEMERLFEVMR